MMLIFVLATLWALVKRCWDHRHHRVPNPLRLLFQM
jgi:hypothetical protein